MLDRTWKRVGKRNGGWEKSNKKGRRNGESIDLLGRNGTEFLNKYYIVAYEWKSMTMCTCIILIAKNLPPE